MPSAIQEGLWFLSKLVPDSPVDNICRAYRVSGLLDPDALGEAWSALVTRQETLRTTFAEVDGRPVPLVGAPPGPRMSIVDLRAEPAGERESVADKLFADRAATPFDLAAEHPARLTLARLDETEYRVLLVVHRIAADDRSVSLLLDELSASYGAEVGGPTVGAALPSLPLRYQDLAARQRIWETTLEYDELLDRVRERLTPAPVPLALPLDRTRPARPSPAAGVVPFNWGPGLGVTLADYCRARNHSPFAVLLAGFLCLLYRHTGQDELAVGVPASVRRGRETERLVGPFSNPVVVRTDLSDLPTFDALVARVARITGAALAGCEVPFTHLVRELRADREANRHPLYDVLFNVRDEPRRELRLPGVQISPLTIHSGATGTDLALTVETTSPSVHGYLEYRAGLFDAETVRAMVDQLRTLLTTALAQPARPVDALPLERPDQVRAAARAADRIAAEPLENRADQLIFGHASSRPDSVAVESAEEAVSYQQLANLAASVGTALRAAGVAPGSAVAVRVSPGPKQYAALLGVFLARAHLTWFGTGDAGDRGKAVLDDLRPACLLVDHPAETDALATWFQTELAGQVLDISAVSSEPSTEDPGDGLSERAYVAYTSGSTGRPKGIAQTHAALVQFSEWMGEEFRMGPGARVAQWVAPEHDPALAEVFATLVSGGTLCVIPEKIRVHPEKLVDWLAEQKITHIQTVPSFARELLRVIVGQEPENRPVLEHILLMGEAVAGELTNGLRAALPGTRLINLYGPTETIVGTWHEICGTVYGTAPIGQPVPGRQILLLDDADRPCATGVTGEIVIRTPYVTPGYVGAETGNPAAFRPVEELDTPSAGTYRTGDLGRRRWNGLLEFRGRKDFQVKLLGNRVELTDIEAALTEHDSIAECAVVAIKDRDGLVNRLVIYVVPRPGGPRADVSTWRSHLRQRFGKLLLPAMFRVLEDRLPRNVAGKVDRRRLPDPGPLSGETRAPRPGAEQELAVIWSELLDVEVSRISPDESFFAVGGHSLLIPRLADRVRDRFNVDLPLSEFFANPSLAGISALVESAGEPRASR